MPRQQQGLEQGKGLHGQKASRQGNVRPIRAKAEQTAV